MEEVNTYLEAFKLLVPVRLLLQCSRHRRPLELPLLPPPPLPFLLRPSLLFLACHRLRMSCRTHLLDSCRIKRRRVRVKRVRRDRPRTLAPPLTPVLVVRLRQLNRGRAPEEVVAEDPNLLGRAAAPFLPATLALAPAVTDVRVQRERLGVVVGVREQALELVRARAGGRDYAACEKCMTVGPAPGPVAVVLGVRRSVGLEARQARGEGGLEGIGPGEVHVGHRGSGRVDAAGHASWVEVYCALLRTLVRNVG